MSEDSPLRRHVEGLIKDAREKNTLLQAENERLREQVTSLQAIHEQTAELTAEVARLRRVLKFFCLPIDGPGELEPLGGFGRVQGIHEGSTQYFDGRQWWIEVEVNGKPHRRLA